MTRPIWRTETSEPVVTFVASRNDQVLVLSPEGHYLVSPGIEKDLVYVVQTDAGQDTLTPAEFSQRYGWKNDPERVRLPPAP